ncbi:MAG: U32 family peptidase [Pirellulales bacterium]|nr:U32 family peptidase [Pirellulales bacterium]
MSDSDAINANLHDKKNQELELLAPAGEEAALAAALEAGADAVYFGLKTLNARQKAKNFTPEEFARAVETVHARGAKAYLTLNTDLAQREIGQAARILELARLCRADAVLVRDPALMALRGEFPELEFHFSTQTCMANSADVAAAAALGADRAVLAREMTLHEIAAASAVPNIATEVFVQGALCFSVSGRCLISSWIGGHSGNRGSCTSPCRVPWSVNGDPAGTPLSMRDLAAILRIDELRKAGVTALKIEGRLKKAEWVGRAVALYRRAIAGERGEHLLDEAAALGDYTGRAMTGGYLDGRRDNLTGTAGRSSRFLVEEEVSGEGEAPAEPESGNATRREPRPPDCTSPFDESDDIEEFSAESETYPTYALEFHREPKGILCRCTCEGRSEEWRMPQTVVHRPKKAVSIGAFFDRLATGVLDGHRLGERFAFAEDFLLVPRAVNGLIERIAGVIRRARKTSGEMIRIELPPKVRDILAAGEPHGANRRALGGKPDRARIEFKQAAAFLKQVQPKEVIFEGLSAGMLPRVLGWRSRIAPIVALPPIFFEEDLRDIERLVETCAKERVTVEVNGWGGWYLAKRAGAAMEAGPGMPVLNSLAARLLGGLGLKCVTLSPEADRHRLEDLSAQCGVPCSLVVFGRPPLLSTRVKMPEDMLGKVFSDRRGANLVPRRERGLTVFRPVEPYDLRDLSNEKIRAAHLVVDLVGAQDPVGDWHAIPTAEDRPLRFNYERTLA